MHLCEFRNNRRLSKTAARESFIFSPSAKPNTPWQVWARMTELKKNVAFA